MERILKAYLKRLTNLSTRNKSLLLSRLSAEQFLDLNETDFVLSKPSVDIVRQLVQRKGKIVLCDAQDARYEKVNEISKKLRKIARTEQFIEEERGSRDLYVGYPFVKGKLSDGTPIHAPLLFFPVTLKLEKEQWCLLDREETGLILNQSFALAYAHFNESPIGDEVLEKSFEDFSKDFLEFRTQLYEWLKTTPLKINFNQELFEDKLAGFHALKSTELQDQERNGELKLCPEAVLGIFPQAGSYLVPDYNWLLENLDEIPDGIPLLEPENAAHSDPSAFLPQPEAPGIPVREEDMLTPFSIDESQEEIVLAVKAGKSVVVQGPPGSGKSQLICNLMADFASRGKRVLLVCQKRAALDVVYARLASIGMKDFVGLVHDFKNDRPQLYNQLASQIALVEDYRKQNYSLDAVFLERQFAQESRAIDRTVGDLNAFRKALFDENECGVSIKELYLNSNPQLPFVDLNEHYKAFRPDGWDVFRRHLKTYAEYALYFHSGHSWSKRRSFADFTMEDLRNMESMLAEWPAVFTKQKKKFEDITRSDFTLQYLSARAEILDRLADVIPLIGNNEILALLQSYIAAPHNAQERLAFIRQTADELEGFLAEDGIEFSLETKKLPVFRAVLQKTIDTKKTMVTGFWWDLFGKEKKEIEQVAQANGLGLSIEDLAKLEVKVRNRQELESWLANPVLGFNIQDVGPDPGQFFLSFFKNAEQAADALVRISLRPWFPVLSPMVIRANDCNALQTSLQQLESWLRSWDRLEQIMLPYLLPGQLQFLLKEPDTQSAALLTALQDDFDAMVDMDRLWAGMNETEAAVTKKVIAERAAKESGSANQIVELFENSVRLAWISHIETKYPDLRAVTSLKMRQWEEQLQGSIQQKQKLSTDITGIKLKEATYEDIEKNRLGNQVTYRELAHQVTKKRKIWPVRKLIEHYTQEVFSLVPCWMASPEAVSAIFPLQAALLDLVIFDEASQCYAEYGLPAAFRGRQIVIAGDSKQLSPSDLYKVRFEDRAEEEEYIAAVEVESLLDLATQSLDQYQLTGHYRSLSLDLIDFSNRHFYKNSLKLLPDFQRINEEEPGIRYVKTDGIWKNNVNLAEVEKVLEILKELGSSGRSVGVVTFNFYQQQAIQEALEKQEMLVKDLFVKNIENVQGDERDVIIFSMAYAPDEKGRISMQFGTLNMQGGENRLNVAVTRARERIYFVTSLLPSQLQTENTANAGPKMLKEYLQYALEVSEGRYHARPSVNQRFRSEWLLKDRLESKEPAYCKELPFGDLTIKEEGVYKGLVLTDDDLYFHSKSSKEPHAYLPLLLRQKNWPFRRVYSREYWTNKLPSVL